MEEPKLPIRNLPPEVMAKFAKTLHYLQDFVPSVKLEVSDLMLFMVVGHLQLALRHPEAVGPSSQQVRSFTRSLEEILGNRNPELVEIMAAGWNPDYDLPADKKD